MAPEDAIALIEEQDWLEPLENGLKNAISEAFSAAGPNGRKTENFLHGTWLGHPLHPVLTDIPIGAWTAALVLDVMDAFSETDAYGRGADAALATGLTGAVGAALAGLTDWHKIDGKTQRLGLIHGLLNLTGAALYTTSLIKRKQDRRVEGRLYSLFGYTAVLCSAWLGGILVYRKQIGVDHTAGEPLPREFVPALAESELPEGQLRRVTVDGVKVLLVRRNGEIHALAEVCSHEGGPLAEGTLEDDTVRCPWHGSRFSLEDGKVVDGPATHPQPSFETRVQNGLIEIRARAAAE